MHSGRIKVCIAPKGSFRYKNPASNSSLNVVSEIGEVGDFPDCLKVKEPNLLARLLALYQLRNFLHEFTEKCYAVFGQSNYVIISRGIGCSYFSGNFLLSFLLWHDLRF